MLNFLSASWNTFWIEDAPNGLNLAISTLTNVGCLYCIVVFGYWWWRLRISDTNLRHLFLSIIVAKFGIWLWTFSTTAQIMWFGGNQPWATLPSRLFIFFGVMIQIWVTTKVKPAPQLYQVVSRKEG